MPLTHGLSKHPKRRCLPVDHAGIVHRTVVKGIHKQGEGVKIYWGKWALIAPNLSSLRLNAER